MVALIISVASVQAQKSQVIAHRGYWKTAGSAQNSITALQKADSIHCYGSEFDVWLTKDNKLVINHDPVYKMKYMEYSKGDALTGLKLSNGENLPSLEQYLEAGKKCNTKLILELKALNSKKRETKAVQEILALVTKMGLMDSFIPLIVPAWFGGGAFYIFLLRQFYLGIPKDFDEAAYLDGASHIQIFTKIILPITKPALAVVGMFAFLNSWNDFLNPLVYLNSEKKYTVALGLQLFTGSYRGEWNLMMAAACLVLAPVVIVFAIGQKYLVEGVTMSGVKG